MGTTRDGIFGRASGAEPASPGSYGEPPRGSWRLPEQTRLGAIRLQVSDLERSLAFYGEVLGLEPVQRAPGGAALASQDGRVLVELVERRGVLASGRGGRLGLYHFAILLPDRPSLARFVRHLTEMQVTAGAGDHLVSEAFYLQDPDGLGIEVYADRPRDAWRRIGRELMMATDPVNVEDLLAAAGDTAWSGMPAGTAIGHVHLHVGDVERAAAYYSDALGFDRINWSYPGALFMSAGGYHHHLGTNTWAGPRARQPDQGDARLLEWTIEVPETDAVAGAEQSLAAAGFPVERVSEHEVSTEDPWGTAIRIVGRRSGDERRPAPYE